MANEFSGKIASFNLDEEKTQIRGINLIAEE
jgi:hypothetical protein